MRRDRVRCGRDHPARSRDRVQSERVVDDLLSLRGRGRTDLSRALAAAAQLGHVPAPEGGARDPDVRLPPHTKGADPLGPAAVLDGLHVLGTSTEPESVAAGRSLARLGHGGFRDHALRARAQTSRPFCPWRPRFSRHGHPGASG